MANKIVFTFIARDQFNRVAKAASSAVTHLRSSVNSVNRALIVSRESIRSFGARVKKSTGDIRDFGLAIGVGVVAPLTLAANKLVNAARDAEETRSKFRTVFKEVGKESQKVANDLAKNFGLSGTAARQMLGDTGDLLTGFGFAKDEALKMSKRVNELAVDLASFTNYSGGAKGASEALTKALLGERDSLKSLGIAISEDNVKKEIALLTSQGQRFTSLRQAKAQATLSLAIKQSTNAIGDFARTQNSLANQERILSARTQDVAEKYGKLIIPIKLLVVKYLGKLLTWLDGLSPTTKKWSLIIAGATIIVGALVVTLGALAAILPILATGVTLLLSPFSLILTVFAAVVTAGTYLYNNFETVREGAIAVVGTIVSVYKSAVAIVQKVVEWVTAGYDKIIAIKNAVGGAWSNVKGTFGFGEDVAVNSSSRTDVNVNLKAPPGAVESVKRSTTGSSPGMNIGVNMATTGG